MTAEQIEQEIERTREHLGETVDELAAKADVRARARVKAAEARALAQERAAEVRAQARDRAAELSGRLGRSQVVQRRWPLAVAAGMLIAASVVIWRRKKA